jgi:hypothetical protein
MQESERGKFEDEWKKAFDKAELTPSEGVWSGIAQRAGQGGQKLYGVDTGWKKAFDGAELNPSDEVWKAIDVSLVQAENARMKGRVVFYQRLAATSVIMLMLMGGYFLFQANEVGNETALSNTNGNDTEHAESTSTITKPDFDSAGLAKMGDSQLGDKGNSLENQTANLSIDSKELVAQGKEGNTPLTDKAGAKTFSQPDQSSVVNSGTHPVNQQSLVASNIKNANTNVAKVVAQGDEADTQLITKTDSKGISQPNHSIAVNSTGNQINDERSVATSLSERNATNSLVAMAETTANSSGKPFVWDSPIAEVQLLVLDKLPDFFGPNDYGIAYRLADARPAVRTSKRKPVASDDKWAAVAFSAGTFSPSVGGGELTQASNRTAQSPSYAISNLSADQPVREEKVSVGKSMAFAVAAGKRIFKKWSIQGGISYLNQTSTSNADAVTVAPANQMELADTKMGFAYKPENTNSVTYSTPSEINSNFQFISIPVQAGYMVVDRKFGVQINGGVSPDFFLKSSVYDESTQTETISSASDNNESFKFVSLAGIGGIELSYRFSRHYRLSLAPGFRYALTPVYKENSLASAKPFVADIGLRFRYVFN